MMNYLAGVFSLMSLRSWIALIMLSLTDKISAYGQSVHQRYPTGDVVVSERDLAEQLRKRPDAVVTALNLLLNEQRVQRAPLRGYWRLNV